MLLPERIATRFNKLSMLSLKLHKTASSIAFIKQALFFNVVPKFAKLHGQFLNNKSHSQAERSLMIDHVLEHTKTLSRIQIEFSEVSSYLHEKLGSKLYKLLFKVYCIEKWQDYRLQSFKTKNKKLKDLTKNCHVPRSKQYDIPIINLGNIELTERERCTLSFGLDHSFIDKNKNVKTYLAANFESLAESVEKSLKPEKREQFHEFLRAYTDIFTKNVYAAKDYTYYNLKRLIKNNNVAIVPGDKESCVVIMKRSDYMTKMQNMIDEGIENGIYEETTDTTLKDLSRFKDFLYRNFKNYKKYKDMLPTSSQPAQMYGLAKTHKFENIADINIDQLKFRPIIAQVGTSTYKAAQVIANYLKPLISENTNIIKNTQSFPEMLKNQPHLNSTEEYVSYDVESLFTNVPVRETIDFIIDQIYNKNKLKPIATKLIFKRLLLKLATESVFIFNEKFYKQTDGCTMGGPLSVIFADIFMTKLENDVVTPKNPKFYKRFVDDSIRRREKGTFDELLQNMNNYHAKIKFTTEVAPVKFLDTEIAYEEDGIKTSVYRSDKKLPVHWSSKIPKKYKRNAINTDLHRAKKIASNFADELNKIRQKFKKANYPERFTESVIRQFAEKNDDEPLIPTNFFEIPKSFVWVSLPYCEKNEEISKNFIRKFHKFTGNAYTLCIKWNTKKVKSLLSLKSKNPHPSCKIYYGECNCGETYIGETARNVEVRWKEHNSLQGSSEPSRHLQSHPDHAFSWKVLFSAPLNTRERKNLEASIIAIKRPSLNNQIDTKVLLLFRNGIT